VPEVDAVRDERDTVVPLELFFDLVFVFAFTQVTTLLRNDPTWGGVLRATLLLSVLWWAWSAYAWLTNTVDPEEGGVRMAVFAAIAALLLASLVAPRAFGRDATTFAVAYLIVRALHLVLYANPHDVLRTGTSDAHRMIDPELADELVATVPLLAVDDELLGESRVC
jgi:low temperature requirement protein LtrA